MARNLSEVYFVSIPEGYMMVSQQPHSYPHLLVNLGVTGLHADPESVSKAGRRPQPALDPTVHSERSPGIPPVILIRIFEFLKMLGFLLRNFLNLCRL